jgi:hypothetical protein
MVCCWIERQKGRSFDISDRSSLIVVIEQVLDCVEVDNVPNGLVPIQILYSEDATQLAAILQLWLIPVGQVCPQFGFGSDQIAYPTSLGLTSCGVGSRLVIQESSEEGVPQDGKHIVVAEA